MTTECPTLYYLYVPELDDYKIYAIEHDLIEFNAMKGSIVEDPTGEPDTPVIDLTKQYRIKAISSGKYLFVENNDPHESGTTGGVIVYKNINSNAQLFTLEDAGNGAYYIKSATGYYIYCQEWNVDAYSTIEKTALRLVDQGSGTFYLQNANTDKYFKVQQVGFDYYVFCDCDGVDCTIETWTLEAVENAIEDVTEEPTEEVTEEVTDAPTEEVTEVPTEESTEEPTEESTEEPTEESTEEVTEEPTEESTEEVTEEPTEEPTKVE
jgi:hypothetical protein